MLEIAGGTLMRILHALIEGGQDELAVELAYHMDRDHADLVPAVANWNLACGCRLKDDPTIQALVEESKSWLPKLLCPPAAQ